MLLCSVVASEDYIALIDEELVFPSGSVTNDTMCTNSQIENDNILEGMQDFTVQITMSTARTSVESPSTATVTIQDDEGKIAVIARSTVDWAWCIAVYLSFDFMCSFVKKLSSLNVSLATHCSSNKHLIS